MWTATARTTRHGRIAQKLEDKGKKGVTKGRTRRKPVNEEKYQNKTQKETLSVSHLVSTIAFRDEELGEQTTFHNSNSVKESTIDIVLARSVVLKIIQRIYTT